jgi:hypothetical protein
MKGSLSSSNQTNSLQEKSKNSSPQKNANQLIANMVEPLVKGLMAGAAHLVTFHLLKRYFFNSK